MSTAFVESRALWAPLCQQQQQQVPAVTNQTLLMLLPNRSLPAGRAPAELACQAVLSWAHVALNVVLVVLVSTWQYRPPPHARPLDQRAGEPPSSRNGSRSNSSGCARLRRSWGAAAVAAAAATERADRILHSMLSSNRLGVLWYLVAATWVWCKALAGL